MKPWLCSIGRCACYHTDTSSWPSKWPAIYVHFLSSSILSSHTTIANDHVMVVIGKDRVKSRIEPFDGKFILAISGLTDALIVGDKPGNKTHPSTRTRAGGESNRHHPPLTRSCQRKFPAQRHWPSRGTNQYSANLRHTCSWSRLQKALQGLVVSLRLTTWMSRPTAGVTGAAASDTGCHTAVRSGSEWPRSWHLSQ